MKLSDYLLMPLHQLINVVYNMALVYTALLPMKRLPLEGRRKTLPK